jgi:23S rRNA (uridine2552-2'-O)-methyltransferase
LGIRKLTKLATSSLKINFMPKAYVPNDRFAKRAQYQGYRARSVYKLEELDKKFHLFKPQQKVLDVGAFPGSWLQYVAIQVGERGQSLCA